MLSYQVFPSKFVVSAFAETETNEIENRGDTSEEVEELVSHVRVLRPRIKLELVASVILPIVGQDLQRICHYRLNYQSSNPCLPLAMRC